MGARAPSGALRCHRTASLSVRQTPADLSGSGAHRGSSLASIFFIISLAVSITQFVRLRSAYVSGRSSVVEGVVEDFQSAPALGPAWESFSVRGIIFSYNALDDTPCFHNAPIHGGPIQGGLDVRIHYNGE